MKSIIAFVVGATFATGLVTAGMTKPAKVVGFLDFAGDWDPTLAFVMGSALLVFAACYFGLSRRRAKPLLAGKFDLPTTTKITWQLCVGATLFGLGWGLSGSCPGPAIASIATFDGRLYAVLFGIIVGNLATRTVQAARLPSYDDAQSAGRSGLGAARPGGDRGPV